MSVSVDSIGVNGNSVNGPGVAGFSENATGVAGFSEGARGVNGGSTTGNGVEGHSDSGSGVMGESSSHFGMFGGSDGPLDGGGVGVFAASRLDVGVFGVSAAQDGTGDGVGGFSRNSIGGRFASESGIGVRGVSPGAVPAIQTASGTVGSQPHFDFDPDEGLALEVIGQGALLDGRQWTGRHGAGQRNSGE